MYAEQWNRMVIDVFDLFLYCVLCSTGHDYNIATIFSGSRQIKRD